MIPYDAAYVVWAELLECPLITADRRPASARNPQTRRGVASAG